MTKDETSKILTVIESIYPTFKVSDPMSALTSWHWALQDYEYADISRALNIYIKTDGTNFAPSVSKLISLINVEQAYSFPSESEAWAMVRKALSCVQWDNPSIAYNALPEIVRRAVVNPSTLKEWAMLDIDEVDTVICSNFLRVYRSVCQQQIEESRLPEEVRTRIEDLRRRTEHKRLEG